MKTLNEYVEQINENVGHPDHKEIQAMVGAGRVVKQDRYGRPNETHLSIAGRADEVAHALNTKLGANLGPTGHGSFSGEFTHNGRTHNAHMEGNRLILSYVRAA